MNDEARNALSKVLRKYGNGICNTPRSCEMFIRQECGAYPDESHALIEALKHGVTSELMAYEPANAPWEAFSDGLRSRLQKGSKLSAPEGIWAVDTWARALGRHPDVFVPAAPVIQQPAWAAGTPATDRQLTIITTVIVSIGGALGSALGAILIPAALLLTMASTKVPLITQPVRSTARSEVWVSVILVLIMIAAIGAVAGAVGAAVGWIYGKGDRGHWTAFATSFGGGFASSALGSWVWPIVGSFVGGLVGSFTAATTTARCGGLA